MNLIDLQGRPVWGRLPHLPANINWRNFDARNAMGKRRPAWQKSLLFKHFDFYSVASPGFTFGCGMVRLGLVNSTFAYLYTPLGGLHYQQFDLPGDWGLHMDTRPLGQTGWVHPFKKNHWARSTREAESRNLVFQFGEHFSADVTLRCEPAHVLALNTPIANTGFAYAQKTSGCPVVGQIRLGDEVHAVQAGRDGCYHDWTAGFLRRETFWNWACATGVNAQGERVSVNVARGVNETSAHENVVWVDGAMHTLPLVLFDYDRDDVSQPWRVYSQCAAVDLKFTPVGSVHDHRNLWVLASRFNQCFGVFSGQVMLPDGRAVLVDGLHGWCEDHYAKW